MRMSVDAEAGQELGPELGQFGGASVTRAIARHGDDLSDGRASGAWFGPQQDHPIRELQGLFNVVGHEQDRGGCGRMDLEQEILHPEASQRVQRPERLVQEENPGAAGEGPGQGRPLGHATGYLARPVAGERGQSDQGQELGDMLVTVAARRSRGQTKCHVAGQRPPRQEPRLLEREGTARVDTGDGVPPDPDLAGRRLIQTGGDVQERRLAAAACSEDRDDLARPDGKREVPEDDVGSCDRGTGTQLVAACGSGKDPPQIGELDAVLGVVSERSDLA